MNLNKYFIKLHLFSLSQFVAEQTSDEKIWYIELDSEKLGQNSQLLWLVWTAQFFYAKVCLLQAKSFSIATEN